MLTLVHYGETLVALKRFAQPIDRTGVLHTPRYDICGSWKILLAKTIRFVHPKIQRFQKVRSHMLRSTCRSTCPLPQRVLLLEMKSRLYESIVHEQPTTRAARNPLSDIRRTNEAWGRCANSRK